MVKNCRAIEFQVKKKMQNGQAKVLQLITIFKGGGGKPKYQSITVFEEGDRVKIVLFSFTKSTFRVTSITILIKCENWVGVPQNDCSIKIFGKGDPPHNYN